MQKRNANIELIRIISMLMIVYHHFSIHTNWNYPEELGVRKYIIMSVGSFGKIGVLLFVLITGYFYSKQKHTKKKIINLNYLITFYTLSIFTISLLWKKFTFTGFFKALFPIIFEQYWFVTGYVLLLLFQPFVKKYLINTPKKAKLKFLVPLILFLYLPSIFGFLFQVDSYISPNELLIFIFVALCGDLIKEYQSELLSMYFKYAFAIFTLTLTILLSYPFVIDILNKYHLDYPSHLIKGTESLNVLLFSISFFILILKLKIPSRLNNTIFYLSNSTFDVYLIHDNRILRPLIWNTLFSSGQYYWTNKLIPIVILVPLIVFFSCLFLSKIRQRLFNMFKRNKHTTVINKKSPQTR